MDASLNITRTAAAMPAHAADGTLSQHTQNHNMPSHLLPAVLARTLRQHRTPLTWSRPAVKKPLCFYSTACCWLGLPSHLTPFHPFLHLPPPYIPSPISDRNAQDAAGILYKPQHSTRRCLGAPQQLLLQQRRQGPNTDTQHVLGIAPMQRTMACHSAAARTHCPGRLLHGAAAAKTLSSLASTHCRLWLQPSSSKMIWWC